MIKPNELKVGNWVFESDGRYVHLHDGFGIDHAHQFNPIPLSPEILKKCGLKDPAGNGMGYRMDHGNIMEFCFYVQDGFMRYQTKGSGMSLNFDQRIKSLHLFQNLYSIMTGKELKISL